MGLAELLAGGLGGLAGLSSKNAADSAYSAYKRRHNAKFRAIMEGNARNLGLQEEQIRGLQETISAGFGRSRAELSTYGNQAKSQARTDSARTGASARQSLVSRGFHSTGALDAVNRGISFDLQRRLSSIDQELGRMFGASRQTETGALAQAKSSLASFYGYRGEVERDTLLKSLRPERGSQQSVPDVGGLASLFSGIGGLFPSFEDNQANAGLPGSSYDGPPNPFL